jgi:hypothetical protein
MEAAACEAAGPSVATLDAGSAAWNCYEAMCATSLQACAADCTCNNAILASLMCVQSMGGNAADAGTMYNCFSAQIMKVASNMNAITLAGCLQMHTMACSGYTVGDGSMPEAAGGEGGDAATPTDASGQ